MTEWNIHKQLGWHVDILLTFSIIAALIFTMVYLINPWQRMAEARNSQRISHVETYLNAVKIYQVDNDGKLPEFLDENYRMIGTAKDGCDVTCGPGGPKTQPACWDAEDTLGQYLDHIPHDPVIDDESRAYYALARTSDKTIWVIACGAELGRDIHISR